MHELITASTTMTSIQIAEIIGKQHKDVLRDIRDESVKLEAGGIDNGRKFALVDYTDAKGESRPCYRLTREGVLQLAARYDAVTRAKLIEMAMRTERPQMSQIEILASITSEMAAQEQRLMSITGSVEAVTEELEEMKEVIALDQQDWREGCMKLVKRIAMKAGGYSKIQPVWAEIHRNIDSRLGANLQRRLENKRARMAAAGATKSERDAVSKLDIIAEDKKLIDGTIHIIKMLAVKNGVRWTEDELP